MPVAAEPLPELPVLDFRCRTDADGTVKNIGNCCGFLPACVNTASPTAPDPTLARCAASTEEPICVHPMIHACLCGQGIFRADPSAPGERVDPDAGSVVYQQAGWLRWLLHREPTALLLCPLRR